MGFKGPSSNRCFLRAKLKVLYCYNIFLGPGPFVASIAPMLRDFLKWSVLFVLLFVPYASIFWMIFGPTNENHAPFLSDIPGLIFTVFSMAALSNLSMVDDLVSIDENMARILVGSFVAVSTIVTLNLLIAMLADTFTRYMKVIL